MWVTSPEDLDINKQPSSKLGHRLNLRDLHLYLDSSKFRRLDIPRVHMYTPATGKINENHRHPRSPRLTRTSHSTAPRPPQLNPKGGQIGSDELLLQKLTRL
jgi:hypothetical protein